MNGLVQWEIALASGVFWALCAFWADLALVTLFQMFWVCVDALGVLALAVGSPWTAHPWFACFSVEGEL